MTTAEQIHEEKFESIEFWQDEPEKLEIIDILNDLNAIPKNNQVHVIKALKKILAYAKEPGVSIYDLHQYIYEIIDNY